MSRRAIIVLIIAALLLIALGLRFWLASRRGEGLAGLLDLFPSEDRLVLKPASFADLPGWRDDAIEEAVPALLRSCERIAALPDAAPIGEEPFAGTAKDWREICAEASRLPSGDREGAKRFFENRFRPYAALNRHNPFGLFTGYYEALLNGSRKRGGKYTVPIYMRPPELVMVDLGRFRDELKGRRIAGKVVDGDLVPYPDRRQIDSGALAGRKLEIVWVDDPIDAFFLHVQGSGRVRLTDGSEMRIGYAAQNGHPYTAIGKELIARGALPREKVSMQSIRAWLDAHPDQLRSVLDKDASYIFFREIEGDGPLGAEGVPLTPGRSLAVDLKYMPMGVPLWLVCGAPAPREGEPNRKIERLMMAQDTGGAIQGPVRGDFFWGSGDEAESVAGRMKQRGRYWLLLPRALKGQQGQQGPQGQ